MPLPPSPTGLYWSYNGDVACIEHAPQTGDRRWSTDKWMPIPMTERGKSDIRYKCQFCRRSPLVHKVRTSEFKPLSRF